MSHSDICTHVKVGVSRKVYDDALLSRSSITRSRNSAGLSPSNATTNSWSSRPYEYVVFRRIEGYFRPMRTCSSIIAWRSAMGSMYQARVLMNGYTNR